MRTWCSERISGRMAQTILEDNCPFWQEFISKSNVKWNTHLERSQHVLSWRTHPRMFVYCVLYKPNQFSANLLTLAMKF